LSAAWRRRGPPAPACKGGSEAVCNRDDSHQLLQQ
jgi:hypothetical protein